MRVRARRRAQNKKEKAMFSKMFKEDTRKAAATSKPHGERNTPKPSPERREPGKPTSRNRLGAGRAAAAGAALLAVLIGFVALRRRAAGSGH